MAPRVPVELSCYRITVVVEPDYVTQGRHTGEIGEAVRGRRADLHLVYSPDDLPAYRHALAGVLLDRAGLAGKLPPALARGAALWLSRDWYGKPYPDWLPVLAAARALPDAAEILAREEPEDASPLLSAPAAAAVIDRLPGATLTAKLAHPPTGRKGGGSAVFAQGRSRGGDRHAAAPRANSSRASRSPCSTAWRGDIRRRRWSGSSTPWRGWAPTPCR